MNEVLEKLPHHLLSLVIEQPYNNYTARDHAVWRYVMRQNVRFLSKVAHGSYTEGLKKTGISINAIPHMYGMNRILREIGWAAVAVDGFIPPSAFMEFQAYNVLVIAADIRPVNQIEYTPAPDIIHEAAGHAPIIADEEYSAYLKLFGEIGSKAFSSVRDYELYEAVRHLSILKADPNTPSAEIREAEEHLAYIDSTMGEQSEMARIRNLHWWTVEYGLIGSLENPKIYGAGLLSSIGESYNCLQPHVKKLPYTIEAAGYNFDITTQQPQLFVTPDFAHLSIVLNEFADSMALRKGGIESVKKAENSGATATVVLDSGLQISGTFKDCIYEGNNVVYLKTSGNSALAYNNKELPGHGKMYHKEGYGTPAGLLSNSRKPLYDLSEDELSALGIEDGKECELIFESGVKLTGRLTGIRRADGKNLIFSFHNCNVIYKDQVLFDPSWGKYDMATGNEVVSAYPGPADPDAFQLSYKAPSETTHKIAYSEADKKLHSLYQKIRDVRESDQVSGEQAASDIIKIWNKVKSDYPGEWLIILEILELTDCNSFLSSIADELRVSLENLKLKDTALTKLIDDGLAISGKGFKTVNSQG
ncbi:MAG: aromatic amino acid hydroxylase [Chloroflexota bacterium]